MLPGAAAPHTHTHVRSASAVFCLQSTIVRGNVANVKAGATLLRAFSRFSKIFSIQRSITLAVGSFAI